MTTHVARLSGTQATVTLSPSDNLSGVAATCYTINGGAAQSYSGPFNVNGAGSYTITYYSTDGADNTEAIKTASFTITTGPVTITLLANKVIAWCAARQWAIRRGEVGCDSGRASWSRLWMVDKEARRRAGRASAILLSGRSEWESESGSPACVGV